MPVQVVYADDMLYPPSDLEGTGNALVVKASLPMIANKPTGLVGTEPNDRIASAVIKTCDLGRTGHFTIKLNGAVIYTSTQEFTVDPNHEDTFVFNRHDSNNAVSAIPFVPGTAAKVPGFNQVYWAPLQFFRFPDNLASAEITVEFGDEEIGKTIVQKVIRSVPLRVLWKGMVIDGDLHNNAITSALFAEAATRSGGDPSRFIRANYPVENPKFQPTVASHVVSLLPGTGFTINEWKTIFSPGLREEAITRDFTRRALTLKAQNIDRMIMVMEDGLLETNEEGATFRSQKVVGVRKGAVSTADAHEIGHTWPFIFKDDYKIVNNVFTVVGEVAQGYLATLNPNLFGPARPITGSDGATTFGFMGASTFNFELARKDQYRGRMIRYMDLAQNTELDPKIWLFRGILKKNNNLFGLESLPIYKLRGTATPIAEPCGADPDCTTLTYRMKLKDNTIVEKAQPVRIGGVHEFVGAISNIASVSDSVEIPEAGIKKITVLDANSNVLFDKTVSAHSPNLRILRKDSTILTETDSEDDETEADMGDESIKSLVIKGTDVDGDTLYASLLVEDKDGNGDDIALDVPANGITVFDIGTQFMTPGKYKLTVMLTDGYRTVKKKIKVTI